MELLGVRFYDMEMFYLAGVIGVCLLLFLRQHFKKKAKMRNLGDIDIVRAMCGSVSKKKRALKVTLRLIAMMLLIVAIARPKAGLKAETVEKLGADIIVVLDVSKSMLAKDSAPNRFERAKLEMLAMINQLENDRIGLVLFSGSAFMQMPLTLDYSAAKLFVKQAYIDALPQPGSAGATAINLCLDVFERVEDRAKAIVMFTDGEFHDDALLEAGDRAKSAGVAIYAVGFGTEAGGPIPVRGKSGVTDFKKDKSGNVVLTKLDRAKLKQITYATGGGYFTVKNTKIADTLLENFSTLKKRSLTETRYSRFEEKFELPLILAALLLLLESMISGQKRTPKKTRD